MTREEWKEMLPIIQAYVDGKVIEHQLNNKWRIVERPFFLDYASTYRIKPEPKEIWVTFDGGHLYASDKPYNGAVKFREVVE